MFLSCRNKLSCLWSGQPNVSMSGDHIKATCPKCGKYIKFVSYRELGEADLKKLLEWQEKEVLSEYKRGFIDGLETFAYSKDGVQYVGTCGITLEKAKKDVKNHWNYMED